MNEKIIETTRHFDRQLVKILKKKPGVIALLLNALQLLSQKEFQAQSLKVHKLEGDLKDCYSFSLAYDLRVVFEKKKNRILLHNIGSHDEVY